MLGNFACFLSSAVFLKKKKLSEKNIKSIIKRSNSLDPDLARHFVWHDLGPNCLQMLTGENMSMQTVNNRAEMKIIAFKLKFLQ